MSAAVLIFMVDLAERGGAVGAGAGWSSLRTWGAAALVLVLLAVLAWWASRGHARRDRR